MSNSQKQLVLSEGLDGQDDNIDLLVRLFEQLQLATVETAIPQLDLITFAQSAFYFAVIMERYWVEQESLSPDEISYARNSVLGQEEYDAVPLPQYPGAVVDTAVAMLASQNPEATLTGQSYSTSSTTLPLLYPVDSAVGMVYLTTSQNHHDPPIVGELNIGIIILPQYQGKGYGRQTVEIVLEKAFDQVKCHRVQAVLIDHWTKDRSLSFFTRMNFGHEGTLKRSFFSPMELEWKDTTYLAILDTDWVMRGVSSSAPKSLWDELFARHHREREELLRWDDRQAKLKRFNSMETIRDTAPTPVAESDTEVAESDVKPPISSPSSDKGKGKLEHLDGHLVDYRDGYASTSEESDSEMEEVQFKRAKSSMSPFWDPSDEAPRHSVPRSESPDGYGTSSSLDSWEVLEDSGSSSSDSD